MNACEASVMACRRLTFVSVLLPPRPAGVGAGTVPRTRKPNVRLNQTAKAATRHVPNAGRNVCVRYSKRTVQARST